MQMGEKRKKKKKKEEKKVLSILVEILALASSFLEICELWDN